MNQNLHIWRSPASKFGIHCEFPDDQADETVTAEKQYSDDELAKIASYQFNAIWVHGQLHHLLPHPLFPEFGKSSAVHLDAMRRLIARAEKHGLKVVLYLQPPRAIAVADRAFWSKHQRHAGMRVETISDDTETPFQVQTLCLSDEQVQQYIREAFAGLTAALPGLGGYMVISASEYPAHCYSVRNCRPGVQTVRKMLMDQIPTECPRCAEKDPWDMVALLLRLIRDGVRSVSSECALIFWNWSWSMYCDPPCQEIISQLPEDCMLMADFERGGYRKHDQVYIDEYSLGYPGPSEQFRETVQLAGERGIRVMAKMQIGTTHELATVCSLPLIGNLYDKIAYLRINHLAGLTGCWNFGNEDSANLIAFGYFLKADLTLGKNRILRDFAAASFPGCDDEKMQLAWEQFSFAMRSYPFSVPFLYNSPVNHALALLPEPGPLQKGGAGRSWLPDQRGDDYRESLSEAMPLEKIISGLGELAERWQEGVEIMRKALNGVNAPLAAAEIGNAMVCAAAWRSSYLLYRMFQLKLNWTEASLPLFLELVRAQAGNLREVLPWLEQDPRQGYHIEGNFYSFSAELVKETLKKCDDIIASGICRQPV